MAGRLLAARLKALRAKISALDEPGSKGSHDKQASLRKREEELQTQGVDGILKEFGFYENPAS